MQVDFHKFTQMLSQHSAGNHVSKQPALNDFTIDASSLSWQFICTIVFCFVHTFHDAFCCLYNNISDSIFFLLKYWKFKTYYSAKWEEKHYDPIIEYNEWMNE